MTQLSSRRLAACLFLLLGTITALSPSNPAQGEPLWVHRTPEHAFLFYDTQARQIGDLIVILVREDSSVRNQENRGMKKSTDAKSLFHFSGKSAGGLSDQESDVETDAGLESERVFDGSANFRSQRAFTDRFTATVVDVLPNGNLVVRGCRDVDIEGDIRTLTVTGVVRPYDVSPDNTVNSRLVAELRMSYAGQGRESSFVKQGWLGRTANRLWPF